MKAIICLGFFLLLTQNIISQQIACDDSVSSIIKNFRKGNKVFRDKVDNTIRHYFLNKKKNQITGITIVNTAQHTGTYYYYSNTELILMRIDLPYSAMPSSRGKPMRSAYFFNNGVLVSKCELNFPNVDIEKYRLDGLDLYKQAVLYIKSKGMTL